MKQDDLLKTRVSLDDMVTIQEKMNEAQHDDTPIPLVTDNGLKVVGDANKTERKSRDYSIRFRFPENEAQNIDEKDIVQRVLGYVVVKVDFTDVHIVPRRDIDINAAIVKVIPYFQKLKEDGVTLKNRTPEEMVDFVKGMSDEIGDDIYSLVASILNVDRKIQDNMVFSDVIKVLEKLPQDFPEAFSEADAFFE